MITEIPRWRAPFGIGADTEPLVGRALRPAVPDLGAVDHPFLAIARRAGPQAGQVGSGLGLGIAYSADHFALGDQRQPFGLVLLGAVPHDHRRHRCDREVGSGHAPVFEFAHQQVLIARRPGRGLRTRAASSARTSPSRRSCDETARPRRPGIPDRARPSSACNSAVTLSWRNSRTSVSHARCPASSSKSIPATSLSSGSASVTPWRFSARYFAPTLRSAPPRAGELTPTPGRDYALELVGTLSSTDVEPQFVRLPAACI